VPRLILGGLITFCFFIIGPGCSDENPPGETGKSGSRQSGGTGILRGRVLLKGPAPERAKALVVKDVAVCNKIDHLDDRLVVGDDGGIMNAVVSVLGVEGGKKLRSMGDTFTLDQKTCAYLPHIVLVPVGATLKILNDDGILHNIHTYSKLNPAFNIAQPKGLREIKRSFSIPERIGVRCDVHGWMNSWVIVVDHPYHVVTDEHGVFEISGIPPGHYTVECWQETVGQLTATISVGEYAGELTQVFFYDSPLTNGKIPN